jgi:hypothetical protein
MVEVSCNYISLREFPLQSCPSKIRNNFILLLQCQVESLHGLHISKKYVSVPIFHLSIVYRNCPFEEGDASLQQFKKRNPDVTG